MIKRHRLSLVLVLALALGLSTLAPGEALYSAHNQVVSPDPADNTPHVKDGKVLAILPLGNRIYVGGTFSEVKNDGSSTVSSHQGLFALDPATNRIDESFRADFAVDAANNKGVQALAPSPDGRSLFVGGDFGGGKKLFKVSAISGQFASGFNAPFSSAVKDIAVAGNRVFVAGVFTGGLAAVDVDSGALDPNVNIAFTEPRQTDPLNPKPRVESIVLTPDGKTLVAGGNFTKVGGEERWQLALLDVTPGQPAALLNWHTSRYDDRKDDPDDPYACAEKFDTHIKDIDMAPDGSYFVVVTTGGFTSRGPLCDTAARWETAARGTNLQPTWANYDGGDSYTGVAVTGGAVYVSGHMRWMNNFYNEGSFLDATPGPGSVQREGIAALDPTSGLPIPWNPGRERGHGAEALVSTAEGLWVGSDTDYIGGRDFDGANNRPGEYHPKLSFFPLAGGAPIPTFSAHDLPADLYSVGAGGVAKRFFDGSQLGGVVALQSNLDWNKVRGAFAVGGFLYTGQSDGKLLRWTFDGARLGQPAEVSLRGMSSSHFKIAEVTGMFYDNGRLYYTRDGKKELFYRAFLVDTDVANDVIGDQELVASSSSDGFDGRGLAGMTMASGRIYWSKGGDLQTMEFSGGKPKSGTKALVAKGAGLDSRGLFVMPQTTAPPVPIDPYGPTPIDPPAPPAPPAPTRSGYWMVGSDGAVYAFGDAAHVGDATFMVGGSKAADLEPTPSHHGYWIVDEDGGVHTLGDADYFGRVERSGLTRGERVTSLSATPTGGGYWVFTSRGRVFGFGDADHFGDMAKVALNGPVLDSIPTPSGRGYYMVASDGGIFAFGDAKFFGSMGDHKLNAPVQSLVPDPDSVGYWLVASDGGVFAFEAAFRGSMGSTRLNKPMTGMVPFGNGYLMVAEDGGIFNFSDLGFFGSLGDNPPARPVVSVAAFRE